MASLLVLYLLGFIWFCFFRIVFRTASSLDWSSTMSTMSQCFLYTIAASQVALLILGKDPVQYDCLPKSSSFDNWCTELFKWLGHSSHHLWELLTLMVCYTTVWCICGTWSWLRFSFHDEPERPIVTWQKCNSCLWMVLPLAISSSLEDLQGKSRLTIYAIFI